LPRWERWRPAGVLQRDAKSELAGGMPALPNGYAASAANGGIGQLGPGLNHG